MPADDEEETFDGADESGPFCRHWSDPYDCDHECVCGHQCRQHGSGGDCVIRGCQCDDFKDMED